MKAYSFTPGLPARLYVYMCFTPSAAVLSQPPARHTSGPRMQAVSSDSAAVKERVRSQFEQRAAGYDADSSYHPPLAHKLLQLCQLQPGYSLLDLACGTGHLALPAAAAVAPTGRVVGVDLSPCMLQQAQGKAAAQKLAGLVRFVVGDMEQLQDCLEPELQGSVDAAACSAATPFLTDPHKTLATWRSWLKPGGRLAFNAFVPPALQGYEVFLQMANQAYGLNERDPSATLGSAERVTAALEAAGYHNIQVMPEVKHRWIAAGSPSEYGERIWQIALHNNPFRDPADLEAQLGQAKLSQFHDAFVSATVDSIAGSDRFDAAGQRVKSTYTVLHVVAAA